MYFFSLHLCFFIMEVMQSESCGLADAPNSFTKQILYWGSLFLAIVWRTWVDSKLQKTSQAHEVRPDISQLSTLNEDLKTLAFLSPQASGSSEIKTKELKKKTRFWSNSIFCFASLGAAINDTSSFLIIIQYHPWIWCICWPILSVVENMIVIRNPERTNTI